MLSVASEVRATRMLCSQWMGAPALITPPSSVGYPCCCACVHALCEWAQVTPVYATIHVHRLVCFFAQLGSQPRLCSSRSVVCVVLVPWRSFLIPLASRAHSFDWPHRCNFYYSRAHIHLQDMRGTLMKTGRVVVQLEDRSCSGIL